MAMKLLNKKNIVGAAQGALFTGGGLAATSYGGNLVRTKIGAIGNFANTPAKKALVDATTGLLIAGAAGAILGRRNATAGRKIALYMGTGAMLGTVYPLVMSMITRPGGYHKPGGMMRQTVTQALPSASAAPSTAMLRAGGGIVMGAPSVDASAAGQSLTSGRPGGRYINPRFQWSSIREL